MDYSMLIEKMLECLEEKVIPKQKFIDTLSYLSITFKGLTLQELFEVAQITNEEWLLMLVFFKNFFNCYRETVWTMSNDTLKQTVRQRYLDGKTSEGKAVLHTYHLKLGNQMNKTPNSIRKLEEQTINYFFAQEYHLLKQTIADIENFLIMFNPYTKYDLCRYWQYLEGQGYDPVIEYNKRLELFDLHYEPKPEDLFIIILQISRFFKEFADFETKNTPYFRHPLIKDKFVQLDSIEKATGNGNIFNFLSETPLMANILALTNEEFPAGTPGWVFRQTDQEEGWEGLAEKKELKFKENAANVISYLSDIGLAEEVCRMKMLEFSKTKHEDADTTNLDDDRNATAKKKKKKEVDIEGGISALKGHEKLNPEIPHQKVILVNKAAFFHYFENKAGLIKSKKKAGAEPSEDQNDGHLLEQKTS